MAGVLARGAALRFRARGISMYPLIKDGDLLTVAPLSGTRPGRGQVLAFSKLTGGVVVHRLTGRRGDDYLVRGDNVDDDTAVVSPGQILGQVTHIERNGRRVRLGLGPERFLIPTIRSNPLVWRTVCKTWRILGALRSVAAR